MLVGGATDGKLNQPYRISGDMDAAGRNRVEFDDRAWATGRSSLGCAGWRYPTTDRRDGGRLLRRHFAGSHAGVRRAVLVLSSTSSIEVCLNGGLLLRREKTGDFEMIDVTERFDRLIEPGDNVLAIRVAPESGSEPFFDCALLVELPSLQRSAGAP